jgi:hypothetical protein
MNTPRLLYDKYLTLCAEVDHRPLPLIEWLTLFDYLLPDKFLFRANGPFPRTGRNTERDTNTARAKADKLRIGRLTKRGGVDPEPFVVQSENAGVRREVGSTSRNTARTCKKCREYLPATRFAKQGKSTRAICKQCDNSRRVEARKNQ